MEVIVIPPDHWTNKLKFPSNASANAPSNFSGCCVDELRDKFQVPAVQQVLANQGELQVCAWPPPQMEVQRVVAGYVQTGQFIYISEAEILLKMLGQVD
jgi:hypothetical protein